MPPDQADMLLSKAEREGWTRRDVRRAVNAWKVDTGILSPRLPSGDLEDDEYQDLSRAWNRASIAARILLLQSIEEMGAIDLTDESSIGDISL